MSYYQNSCLDDPSRSFFNVTFKKNYDGDTFTIDIEEPSYNAIFSKDISVRLKNIDTGEIRTKNTCEKDMVLAAKERMYEILSKADIIDLCEISRCKYFRIVAEIWINEKCHVQEMLLNDKLAVPYNTPRPINWCNAYEFYTAEKESLFLTEEIL